jgi:hypothetical protein
MNKEALDSMLLIVQILILVSVITYLIKTWRSSSATQSAADVFALSLQVMKEARDQEIAPYIVVSLDVPQGEQTLFLIVKNIGKSTARNVKIQFSPKLVDNGGDDLSELPLLKDGIAAFPPNHELKIFVDSTAAFFFGNNERSLKYETNVSFYGGLKDTQRVFEQTLDLTSIKKMSKMNQRSSHELSKDVDKIAVSIERISKELAALNNNLSDGIQMRNPITSASLKTENDSWHQVITSRLLEFRHLWATFYGGNHEKLLQPFFGKLKTRLSHITDQLLITISVSPSGTEDDLKNVLLDIVAKMAELNSIRVIPEDAKSIKEFDSTGTKILTMIEEIVKQKTTSQEK